MSSGVANDRGGGRHPGVGHVQVALQQQSEAHAVRPVSIGL